MSKCLIYARTANESDFVINNQIESLKYLAGQKNLNVKKIFIDNGYSDTSLSRPEFQKMLRYLINNKVDAILVKDMSRLSRNTTSILKLTNELRELGIKIYNLS